MEYNMISCIGKIKCEDPLEVFIWKNVILAIRDYAHPFWVLVDFIYWRSLWQRRKFCSTATWMPAATTSKLLSATETVNRNARSVDRFRTGGTNIPWLQRPGNVAGRDAWIHWTGAWRTCRQTTLMFF